MTLGRPRQPRAGGGRIRDAPARLTVPALGWRADAVVLHESRRGPGGASYRALARAPLGCVILDGDFMTWLLVAASYLAGAVPFAHLVARGFGGLDVRSAGSGNVGATNVLRIAGLPLAGLVLALDAGKGAAAVLAARAAGVEEGGQAAAAAAAVAGHVWPVWLRFRGGKGVAVAGGAFAVLAPVATGMAAAVFVTVVMVSRYVSLGSLAAAAALPLLALAAGAPAGTLAAAAGVAGLILARHRANLGRLRSGTESRLAWRRRLDGQRTARDVE